MGRVIAIVVLLAAVVAAPMVMRRDSDVARAAEAEDRLVVITPHNETIRSEFGEAFAAWWKETRGRTLYVDWRAPGGSTEIRKVLSSGFEAAAEDGREGIGIDVFFGGGDYEFRKQAREGRLVMLDVFHHHPEWFRPEVIPAAFTGELNFDPDRCWVGVCVSQFGICANVDGLAARGLEVPGSWEDLGDPRYRGGLALADPTKSGSVTRAFEMLLQQRMQAALAEAEGAGVSEEEALAAGWASGMRLIQRIGANARYFTDSASKIPRDVAQGDAVAGMCIDFYGRSTIEWLSRRGDESRLVWTVPAGGTSLSADPVAVLKGAPSPEIAQAFVEFCLSERGQVLWNARPGTEWGPRERSLRRMPIRRDVYGPGYVERFADPEAVPHERGDLLTYRSELTGRAFGALRIIFRALIIDPHHELKEAWRVLGEAGYPVEAMRVFEDVSAIEHGLVFERVLPFLQDADPLGEAKFAAELGVRFRDQYREAARLARGSGVAAGEGGGR